MIMKHCDYIYRHPYYDRYFSQIMRHLLSFFVAKLMNIKHIHTLFNAPKYPKGHENEDINLFFSKLFKKNTLLDITENTNLSINNLLKNKQIFSLPDQNLVKPYNINDIFNDSHIDLLKSSYNLTEHCMNFDPNVFNISVHIRRGDAIYPFGGSYTPLSFFIKTIETIKKILNRKNINYQVHVYSNSNIDLDIENILYHINEDELTTIHDIISSNIFIMSIGSNLSHFGCLLNNGINYLDKSKLIDCFNNKYNIYWSKFRNIITEESKFIEKLELIS